MPKPDEMASYPREELLRIDHRPPQTQWLDTPVDFRPGSYLYPGKTKNLRRLGLPNPREWSVADEDWKLQENWKEIILAGMAERLKKYRSFRLFMDACVRCGACADKCHFFIGGGDPKNMPVLRAELLRSVYRNDFTALGKVLGKLAGGARADHRRDQGVVLLLLSVHGVPPLLGLLPVRHRHGRDHHVRQGALGAARAVRQLVH